MFISQWIHHHVINVYEIPIVPIHKPRIKPFSLSFLYSVVQMNGGGRRLNVCVRKRNSTWHPIFPIAAFCEPYIECSMDPLVGTLQKNETGVL